VRLHVQQRHRLPHHQTVSSPLSQSHTEHRLPPLLTTCSTKRL
jgi:hypothetical protein